jgi:hypothetical protein
MKQKKGTLKQTAACVNNLGQQTFVRASLKVMFWRFEPIGKEVAKRLLNTCQGHMAMVCTTILVLWKS